VMAINDGIPEDESGHIAPFGGESSQSRAESKPDQPHSFNPGIFAFNVRIAQSISDRNVSTSASSNFPSLSPFPMKVETAIPDRPGEQVGVRNRRRLSAPRVFPPRRDNREHIRFPGMAFPVHGECRKGGMRRWGKKMGFRCS